MQANVGVMEDVDYFYLFMADGCWEAVAADGVCVVVVDEWVERWYLQLKTVAVGWQRMVVFMVADLLLDVFEGDV